MQNYHFRGRIEICLCITVIWTGLAIEGCSMKKTIQRKQQCKGIEKALDLYWIQTKKNPYAYDISRDGMKELEAFRSCIQLLRKKDVLNIFDQPSMKKGYKWYYLLFGCQDINNSSCAWIEFDFEDDEVVNWEIKMSNNTKN